MRTSAFVFDPAIPSFAGHSCVKIGQVKPRTRNCNSHPISRIQAEEPHSRFAICHNVGPHIQFWKRRESRHRGHSTQTHSGHPERHNSQPCLSFNSIYLQSRRDMTSQRRFFHAPMRKQQIVPALGHDPATSGQRPRTMCDLFQIHPHQVSFTLLDSFVPSIYPSLSLTNRILWI